MNVEAQGVMLLCFQVNIVDDRARKVTVVRPSAADFDWIEVGRKAAQWAEQGGRISQDTTLCLSPLTLSPLGPAHLKRQRGRAQGAGAEEAEGGEQGETGYCNMFEPFHP